jgi:twitching motility protein PilJ
LAEDANAQARAIQSVSSSVEQIAQSIQKVSESAQDAAHIAHQSRLAAQEGEKTMDETVNSIYQIRHSVADTSKKAKRLADSSQEISKIVSIIADISEKTNLLAFNASIEAARAGENGQGFRVVADEVRRLAEQVTFSAQEIEQLVITIQGETAEMMQMMEESTTQVVSGTTLVQKTKETLQKLAQISQEIDRLLESISERTASQKLTSQQVTETMHEVAFITKETASESKSVSESLQQLVTVAVGLQQSASRFQVD